MSAVPGCGNVAVIGAGVIGLSTAVCIQDKIPGVEVTIFADKLNEETLSSGAGGLFRPTVSIDPKTEKVLKWCKSSLTYFLSLAYSSDAKKSGMQHVSGYHLSSSVTSSCHNALLEQLVPTYRNLSENEMKIFPSDFKEGVFYSTIVTDCRYYLPFLKSRFESRGGKILKKHIEKLSEVADDFHIIVNCAGLGSKVLVNDEQLIPVRGQTIKVKAPWIKHFYFGDDVYIIPGVDFVTLGGVKDYGSWNCNVNRYQREFIWDKCIQLVPSLKNAEVLWDWVGLRPYRPSICLNSCIVHCDNKYLKVVNNYGHGGNGITLSWGTAQEASELVKKLLKDIDAFTISKL